MTVSWWYGAKQGAVCVAYYHDAWDHGITYSYREF